MSALQSKEGNLSWKHKKKKMFLPGKEGRCWCRDPPRRGSPGRPSWTQQGLLLNVAHMLHRRPERGSVNHMAETHAQSVRKTRRGRGEEGGHREKRGGKEMGMTEGTRVKVCKTESQGHFKGWVRASGGVVEKERERKRARALETEVVVEFRGQSCRVAVSERQHHYAFWCFYTTG